MKDTQLETIVEAVIKQIQGRAGETTSFASQPAPMAARAAGSRASNMTIAVLGGGNGGLAMGGHLSLLGNKVRIFSFFQRELDTIEAAGGVEIIGKEVSGKAKLEVHRHLDSVVKGADLIMIVSPALTHATYACLLAGLLEDGQIVVLNPGRTGGALQFAQDLQRYALRKRIYLAEAQTFMYAAEMRAPGKVEILKEKFKMRVAALPASDNQHVIPALQQIYPQIEAAQNVLETSLNNVGPINHVPPMLLNTATIEHAVETGGENMRFYTDMINPTVCNMIMEKMDVEKCNLGRKLGLDVWTVIDWYRESYHVTGNSMYEIYQTNPHIAGFSAPKHILAYNNVLDEIPDSLVPMSYFGKVLGVPTPTIDVIVELGKTMTGIDFWKVGRTLDKLGLDGMSPEQMLEYVERQPLLGACGVSGVCRTLPQFA